MTAIASRSMLRRAFGCWPSRIGGTALVALAVSCGTYAFAGGEAPSAPAQIAKAR